ncbi:HlyD family secretion protein [Saprospiraceae bacterium]|nr:HlyD family secretion protein [Saprospiraceae bacterium]
MADNNKKDKSGSPVKYIFIGVAIAVAGYFGITYVLDMLHHETTDNAQIEADIYQLIPQVSGRILKTYVKDYDEVKKGDTLFTINTDEYSVKINSAEAGLQNALAQLAAAKSSELTAEANSEVSNANIAAVKAANVKAQKDLKRGENLVNDDIITRASFDAIKASADAAEAQYQAALSQYGVSKKQIGTSEDKIKAAEAMVAMRRADVANAHLIYSYTAILAPDDGRLAEVNMKEGQFVQAGQPLTSLIGKELWIVANFKETQLSKIEVGEPLDITVDSYPDKIFKGKVTSLSPATGAKFSLLPPDNATGNFVKVVQRVPVKIEFTEEIPKEYHLEAGMNVNVSIPIE